MEPWVHTDKSELSSVGAALTARAFVLDREVPPLWGSINGLTTTNPGLAPWAMQEYRPKGLFDVFTTNQSPNTTPHTITYKNTNECNNPFTHPNTFNEHHNTASKFRRIMSAVGTILLHSPGWNEGKARNGTLGTHR